MTFKFDRLIQKYVDTGQEKGAKVHCTFTCARLHVKAANSIVTHTCILPLCDYIHTYEAQQTWHNDIHNRS